MKKKDSIKKFIGQKFRANWNWYVLLGVSLDEKTSFVRLTDGRAKQTMKSTEVIEFFKQTPVEHRVF